jgi:hypothetical protein
VDSQFRSSAYNVLQLCLWVHLLTASDKMCCDCPAEEVMYVEVQVLASGYYCALRVTSGAPVVAVQVHVDPKSR